ncbi:unnamed protein product [Amoebophrya sp. A120]|nr:unnamed protein product [Amoebophrya sp. A120]|eukprot:GSA120T00016071001.1
MTTSKQHNAHLHNFFSELRKIEEQQLLQIRGENQNDLEDHDYISKLKNAEHQDQLPVPYPGPDILEFTKLNLPDVIAREGNKNESKSFADRDVQVPVVTRTFLLKGDRRGGAKSATSSLPHDTQGSSWSTTTSPAEAAAEQISISSVHEDIALLLEGFSWEYGDLQFAFHPSVKHVENLQNFELANQTREYTRIRVVEVRIYDFHSTRRARRSGTAASSAEQTRTLEGELQENASPSVSCPVVNVDDTSGTEANFWHIRVQKLLLQQRQKDNAHRRSGASSLCRYWDVQVFGTSEDDRYGRQPVKNNNNKYRMLYSAMDHFHAAEQRQPQRERVPSRTTAPGGGALSRKKRQVEEEESELIHQQVNVDVHQEVTSARRPAEPVALDGGPPHEHELQFATSSRIAEKFDRARLEQKLTKFQRFETVSGSCNNELDLGLLPALCQDYYDDMDNKMLQTLCLFFDGSCAKAATNEQEHYALDHDMDIFTNQPVVADSAAVLEENDHPRLPDKVLRPRPPRTPCFLTVGQSWAPLLLFYVNQPVVFFVDFDPKELLKVAIRNEFCARLGGKIGNKDEVDVDVDVIQNGTTSNYDITSSSTTTFTPFTDALEETVAFLKARQQTTTSGEEMLNDQMVLLEERILDLLQELLPLTAMTSEGAGSSLYQTRLCTEGWTTSFPSPSCCAARSTPAVLYDENKSVMQLQTTAATTSVVNDVLQHKSYSLAFLQLLHAVRFRDVACSATCSSTTSTISTPTSPQQQLQVVYRHVNLLEDAWEFNNLVFEHNLYLKYQNWSNVLQYIPCNNGEPWRIARAKLELYSSESRAPAPLISSCSTVATSSMTTNKFVESYSRSPHGGLSRVMVDWKKYLDWREGKVLFLDETNTIANSRRGDGPTGRGSMLQQQLSTTEDTNNNQHQVVSDIFLAFGEDLFSQDEEDEDYTSDLQERGDRAPRHRDICRRQDRADRTAALNLTRSHSHDHEVAQWGGPDIEMEDREALQSNANSNPALLDLNAKETKSSSITNTSTSGTIKSALASAFAIF